MVVVIETLTAKPGMASKLARMFKDNLAPAVSATGARMEVLTDQFAGFNTVILLTYAPDLAAFEKAESTVGSNPELRERMKAYPDMYLTGKREVFKLM